MQGGRTNPSAGRPATLAWAGASRPCSSPSIPSSPLPDLAPPPQQRPGPVPPERPRESRASASTRLVPRRQAPRQGSRTLRSRPLATGPAVLFKGPVTSVITSSLAPPSAGLSNHRCLPHVLPGCSARARFFPIPSRRGAATMSQPGLTEVLLRPGQTD
ncbi:hypothetical protein VFPBJ_07103 [Purpureocillium lilacinum]|uniref:Uncharacterized protein n=1 Tax=Purpureocillium lilacinum TaxID=33203 RepID=A0A179GMH2_PURLI|nr:hypothetical protein VFPBJ_07103 [Purpureocillium lilacinum]